MDGLFVVGSMNSILYQEYNSELKAKFVQLAIEGGLLEEQTAKVKKAPNYSLNSLFNLVNLLSGRCGTGPECHPSDTEPNFDLAKNDVFAIRQQLFGAPLKG